MSTEESEHYENSTKSRHVRVKIASVSPCVYFNTAPRSEENQTMDFS